MAPLPHVMLSRVIFQVWGALFSSPVRVNGCPSRTVWTTGVPPGPAWLAGLAGAAGGAVLGELVLFVVAAVPHPASARATMAVVMRVLFRVMTRLL